MKIAIVILNWNGKALLEQFLPSVISHSENVDIYVADNASTDNSVAFLKANFPTVTIIKNNTNGGYAKGYNEALKAINADIFCLLNNDVEVTKNWITPIITEFEQNPKTAIVQPKILDYNNKSYFEYAGAGGGFIDKYCFPYCRGRIFTTVEKDTGQYNNRAEIFWASGACFFIRKSIFNSLSGFDAAYFAHMEEIDLCWRTHNNGYKTIYIGASAVYHVGGGTLKPDNPKKTYLNFRNSLFTLIKNVSRPVFFVVFTRLTLDGIAALYFLFKGQGWHFLAVLKAHVSFYYNLPRLLKQRKKSKNSLKYYHKKSIVWSYFINNKNYYNQL